MTSEKFFPISEKRKVTSLQVIPVLEKRKGISEKKMLMSLYLFLNEKHKKVHSVFLGLTSEKFFLISEKSFPTSEMIFPVLAKSFPMPKIRKLQVHWQESKGLVK